MRTDTAALHSPRIYDIDREYQQWTKTHKRIIEGPPQEGRDYVKHAKTLLPILEAVSELHPIAKNVVTAFNGIVMFESDQRKENSDARVAVVLLAQSDMMGTLSTLLNHLAERRRDQWGREDEDLHANEILAEILLRTEKEIKKSANSMDTYYGATPSFRFWKAQEWKDRVLAHMTQFNTVRNDLQHALAIQVAADVNTLMEKADVLLLRLYTPKTDSEKDIAAKTRQLAKTKNAIEKDRILQKFVETNNPFSDDKAAGDDTTLNNAKFGMKTPMQSQLEQLKKDLNSSLDTLCDRNREMFELKLKFHAQQIQDSIRDSANYVVQSLAGPYDRLHNEDLKILWKEMNWIFCVDNKLFTSALFEYYLDNFFSKRRPEPSKAIENDEQHGHEHDLEHYDPDNAQAIQQENIDMVTALTRVGALSHPDAWTLEPMALYGPRISLSIDKDDSGFIRISEANVFTDKMPKGWTLPQWCAYAAIGWTYEARVYRKRINNILSEMYEMQAKVLPNNRFIAILAFPLIAPFFQLMAWEPTDDEDETNPDPPEALVQLVHDKIKKEDEVWREKLRSLNWAVGDETILQLLYGKQPLETYVLQLSVLLLEYAYDVMQAGTRFTLSTKEVGHLVTPLRLVKNLCNSRVAELRAQFEKEKRDEKYLESYHGGIWMCLSRLSKKKGGDDDGSESSSPSENGDSVNNESDDDRPANPRSLPFATSDIEDYDYDELYILEDFPLHPLEGGELPYLKFGTWEEHIQSLPDHEIPDTVPNSWGSDEEAVDEYDEEEYNSRHAWTDLPLSYRNCDNCSKSPIKEYYYGCTVCDDFDICSECYRLPPEQHVIKKHEFSHPVVRFALHTTDIHRNWMIIHADYEVEQMQADLREQWDSLVVHRYEDSGDDQSEAGEEAEVEIGSPYSCNHCGENIPLHSANTFYKCFRHGCEDYSLCDRCAHSHIESDIGHQWWHSMIVLRRGILVDSDDASDNISESGSNDGGAKKAAEDGPSTIITAIGNKISAVDARISVVEDKLDATNAMLQETLSTMLEDRVNSTVTETNDGPQNSRALENRVSQLEDKVDTMLAEMRKVLMSLTSRSEHSTPSQPTYPQAPRSNYQSSYNAPQSDYPASGPAFPVLQPEFPTSQPDYSDPHAGYHAAPGGYSGYNPTY